MDEVKMGPRLAEMATRVHGVESAIEEGLAAARREVRETRDALVEARLEHAKDVTGLRVEVSAVRDEIEALRSEIADLRHAHRQDARDVASRLGALEALGERADA